MIPKVIHQVWVGPLPAPTAWSAKWREMHSGWEYRLWDEQAIDGLDMLNRRQYDYYREKKNYVGMCDIARQAILRQHGGVYTDIDSRPLLTFTGAPFMRGTFFAAYEPTPEHPGRVAAGTIGSAPGHHIWDTIAYLIDGMPHIDAVWDSTGGTVLTAALLAHRQCCSPLVLPSKTLFSSDSRGRPVVGNTPSYCEHFWSTTNRAYPFANVVVLVPRRPGDSYREEAWTFTRHRWEALGYPVIEGRHSGTEPFNAAFARNNAALQGGDWDVAVFVDADTVMFDYATVREGIRQAGAGPLLYRPYRHYHLTDEATARQMLDTGAPPARTSLVGDAHGGVNIISRRLWDRLKGYDERFVGWGYEDAAIEQAARTLGAFRQANKGDVYHVWHPIGPGRGAKDTTLVANRALYGRYVASNVPGAVDKLTAERATRAVLPRTGVVLMTNGRWDCISRTIPSIEAMVGPFSERIICDDSGDPAYVAQLRAAFPDWDVRAHEHLGHGPAVVYAMEQALAMDVDWVFWSEDDFVFQRPVDLVAISKVLEAEDGLLQMAIRRQAWSPPEVAAGGMIERFDPALFIQRDGWIEHRQFFTLNPFLTPRVKMEEIAALWPAEPNSEHLAGLKLFAPGSKLRSGLWGQKTDAPWVIHDGQRTGDGYVPGYDPNTPPGLEPMPPIGSAKWLRWNRERLNHARA